jgi:hypothetical protein
MVLAFAPGADARPPLTVTAGNGDGVAEPATRPAGVLPRPIVGHPIAPIGPAAPAGRSVDAQSAEVIFVGKVTDVKRGPTGMSYPPVYSTTITFEAKEVLRGDVDKSAPAVVHHSARQEKEPQFAQGSDYLVFAKNDARQGLRAVEVTPADDAALKAARLSASLPIGWSAVDGKVVSPWSVLGAAAWPADAKGPAGLPACSKSGRPAFLAGKGVKLEVAPVPPAKSIQWTNPDGDGEYTITVTNTTDKALDVPALLSDESGIRWDLSLLATCQGKAQPALPVAALKGTPKATHLEAGKSVTTTVNALRLKGLEWPRGGYRIEFTFCLGEAAASHSFYYTSKYHDAISDRVQKESGTAMPGPASAPAGAAVPPRGAVVPGLSTEFDP